MMVGVDNALNLHMNTYFWELKSEGNLLFFLASQWVRLLARFSRVGLTSGLVSRPLLSAPYGGRCVDYSVVLRLLGWFPENGTTELITTLTWLNSYRDLVLCRP